MTETEKDPFARLSKEHAEVREGIIAVAMAWSALETSLAMVLRSLLSDRSGALAFAIYFAPQSFEGGHKIVTAAMEALVGANGEFERLQTLWGRTKSTINELKKWRNAVAHGTISTFHQSESHVLLTPNIFDWRRLDMAKAATELPGFDGDELKAAARLISDAANLVSGFCSMFEAVCSNPTATITKQLHELENSRNKLHKEVMALAKR